MIHAQANQTPDDNSPQPLIGLAPLMRQAFSGIDLRPFGTRLVQRAIQHPHDANTLMDLATVLQLIGNRELGLATQAQALKIQQHYQLPTRLGKERIRLLAIMSAGDLMANTPLEFLIEEADISLDLLYVDKNLPLPTILPEHDLVFVALGESDHNLPLLEQISQRAAQWHRPLINQPNRIANLSRTGASALLANAAGIWMPPSVRVTRTQVERLGTNEVSIPTLLPKGEFPIIIRPVDSHAGNGLEKIDDCEALSHYLTTLNASEFYISRFVDYKSEDGQFRKYRIILIEGKPYICHMAISDHWMIHYLNAGMAESPEKRAEEARFMRDFDQNFALRHAKAFQAVTDILQLDYVGLDCGETQDGQLLIFEADSDMIVHAMDPVDLFPYKQATMQKIFEAFHTMLVNAMNHHSRK